MRSPGPSYSGSSSPSMDRALGTAVTVGLSLTVARYLVVKSGIVGEVKSWFGGKKLSIEGDDIDENDPDSQQVLMHYGSCHCKAIQFELLAPKLLKARKDPDGGKIQYPYINTDASNFRLMKGSDVMSVYYVQMPRPYTSAASAPPVVAAHSFCQQCGVNILHAPNSQLSTLHVNVSCLTSTKHVLKITKDTTPTTSTNGSMVGGKSGNSLAGAMTGESSTAAADMSDNESVLSAGVPVAGQWSYPRASASHASRSLAGGLYFDDRTIPEDESLPYEDNMMPTTATNGFGSNGYGATATARGISPHWIPGSGMEEQLVDDMGASSNKEQIPSILHLESNNSSTFNASNHSSLGDGPFDSSRRPTIMTTNTRSSSDVGVAGPSPTAEAPIQQPPSQLTEGSTYMAALPPLDNDPTSRLPPMPSRGGLGLGPSSGGGAQPQQLSDNLKFFMSKYQGSSGGGAAGGGGIKSSASSLSSLSSRGSGHPLMAGGTQ